MTTHSKIELLHGRLVAECERLVALLADAAGLPAAGALAQLADLDDTIVAVEAVIEDAHCRLRALPPIGGE